MILCISRRLLQRIDSHICFNARGTYAIIHDEFGCYPTGCPPITLLQELCKFYGICNVSLATKMQRISRWKDRLWGCTYAYYTYRKYVWRCRTYSRRFNHLLWGIRDKGCQVGYYTDLGRDLALCLDKSTPARSLNPLSHRHWARCD